MFLLDLVSVLEYKGEKTRGKQLGVFAYYFFICKQTNSLTSIT